MRRAVTLYIGYIGAPARGIAAGNALYEPAAAEWTDEEPGPSTPRRCCKAPSFSPSRKAARKWRHAHLRRYLLQLFQGPTSKEE